MRTSCYAGTFALSCTGTICEKHILLNYDLLCSSLEVQMSGEFMLLQHHGLKGAETVSLSAAIAVNYSLTHLDLGDNRYSQHCYSCLLIIGWVSLLKFGSKWTADYYH